MGKSENTHTHTLLFSSSRNCERMQSRNRGRAKRRNTDLLWWKTEAYIKNMMCYISKDVFKKKWCLAASSNVAFPIYLDVILAYIMRISTHSLVVERHHLAADVPKRLRWVIRWVHSCSFGINPAHLSLIISEKDGLGGTHLEFFTFACEPGRCGLFPFCVSPVLKGYSTNSTAFLAIIVSPFVSTKDEMT